MPEGVMLGQILAIVRHNLELFVQCLREDREPNEAEQQVLLDVADRIMKYVDGVSSAVAQAYLDEREQLVSEQERWARAFMDRLVDPSTPPEDLRRLADKTGFDAAETYRPLAACVVDAPAREHARYAIALRSQGVVALTEGDRVSGLAPATMVDSALTRADAVLALDLLPELLLARSPRLAEALRTRVLGPLEGYAERRSPELFQTLAAFVESGLDRRETAAALSVHANTLDYRLRRVEELTGLHLGDPEDLTMAVLALKQDWLAGGH